MWICALFCFNTYDIQTIIIIIIIITNIIIIRPN